MSGKPGLDQPLSFRSAGVCDSTTRSADGRTGSSIPGDCADACTYDGIYNESKTNGFGLKSVLMAIIHSPNFTTRVQDQ